MKSPGNSSVLIDVVTKVLAVGATTFEVEHKDGSERVFACNGALGVGVEEYRSDSASAEGLRRELYALRRKGKKITVSGVEYLLRVRIFDSFGENAFRVTVNRS
jgi:hypothetical protein